MSYYESIPFWKLYGQYLNVTSENDHLGLIVSDTNEEQKNIDKNISSARNALFALLGTALSYKCKVSPTVKMYLWRIYVKPILISGLSALPIQPVAMNSLTSFHHKLLRGFLSLSKTSPIIPLYFLVGELPIEATIHLSVLSLFWNIWSNPQTTAYEIICYIMKMAGEKSATWSAHVRRLTYMYDLPNPLSLLEGTLWTKEQWRDLCHARVRIYHEKKLRQKSRGNHKLIYMNIDTIGLSGCMHPSIQNLTNTQAVETARPHIRMLAGDYPCFANLSSDRGSDPKCRLCQGCSFESVEHILTECTGTKEPRDRILPELLNAVCSFVPENKILQLPPNHAIMTQFILDCTSLNLPNGYRVSPAREGLTEIFRICRQFCFAVNAQRTRLLKLSV